MSDAKSLVINNFCESDVGARVPYIEQYVQDVKDFSSQYGSDISISYTAYNITGKPSKFPDYGDFPQAFVMRTYGNWWNQAPSRRERIMPQNYQHFTSQDYIDIMFEHRVVPTRVSIYETYNPGSVVRIWAYDSESSQWVSLWRGHPRPTTHHFPIIFSPPLLSTVNFLTNLVRLEFDHSKLDYYTELDAVLLTGYTSVGGRMNSLGLAPMRISETECGTPPEWRCGQCRRRCLSPEEDKSPPGRSDGGRKCHIGGRVVDMEVTAHRSKEDVASSLDDLARHYMNLLDDINRDIVESGVAGESCSVKDGFSTLPDEAVLAVLRHLDLMSLMSCSRVNRRFNRLASDGMLFTSIGLQPYWYLVNNSALASLSSKCSFLRKLDLSWCGNYNSVTPAHFCRFIQRCGKLLTHLRLDCCRFIDDLCITTVSETCLGLTELTLRNCSNISTQGYLSLASLRTLKRLDLYRTYIENQPLIAILKNSPSLNHLVLGSCVKISVMDEIAQVLGAYNRDLISVDFWKTYSLTPLGVKALCNCTQLEEIDLGWCLGVSIPGDCLTQLAKSCNKLKKLFMAALRGISDADLSHFIANCPHLQQMDLLGVRNISANICLRVLGECKELKLLDVSFCDQIPDEVIECWVRQFPNVSIKRSFQREHPLPPTIHLHPRP